MKQTAPHFLLLTQAQSNPDPISRGGVWRFVLEKIGSTKRIEISEEEPGVQGERLQLLAVIRGLEALEQPSRVTLITPSRFVGNGIRRGITQWRANGWKWERFGEMTAVKHRDLWERIDQALHFHQINCRIWDFEEPHFQTRPPARNRISFGEIETARRHRFVDAEPISHQPMNFTPTVTVSRQPRQFIANALESITQKNTMLADKVKPIGHGRAFGYVPN